ncbi:MAG: FAD-binding oxidoreductase [Candidatus Zixiibacteriota bacterium]|nr:MAG: FAD-binding oxidoreductase [candidate division Zixibacteria bacterium]
MDKIISFDDELDIVTVQPGVTQKKLYEYLKERNLNYLVPVTGAGPDCSLIGNAIEKGYGITPHADHFGAVMSLEAVLPDGSVYHSAFTENRCEITDKIFKWGIGPYLDGIFAQGNFGIITEMTIAMATVQESVEGFLISIKSDDNLEQAVTAIQKTLKQYGNLMGSINLMNRLRMMSMFTKYPKDKFENQTIIPDELVDSICQKAKIGVWTVGGMIYGNKKIIKEVKKTIRQNFKPISNRTVFFNRKKINLLQKIFSITPRNSFVNIKDQLAKLSEAFKCIEGIPTEVALPLCYWKSGTCPPKGQPMNPAVDNCGLLWYSPLVPMKPDKVREYVDMVKKECLANNIEPLITLTSLSHRCFDSTVPILFDPHSSDEVNNARQCYDSLFEKGRDRQFHPYRVGIDHMDKIINKDSTYWKIVQSVKKNLDPNNILAPGRYNIANQKGEVKL